MKNYLILLFVILLSSCKNETSNEVKIIATETQAEALTADEIIDKSIEVSGGDNFKNSKIFFGFRDKTYMAKRKGGEFVLARMFKENKESITDVYDNSGFKRMVDEVFVEVADSMATKYTASVNSVHYFSVLPYGLNDKAVYKMLLGEEKIKDKNYYKIKVTFSPVGGGEDHEDVFIYWIAKDTFKADYLAYSYNEDKGIGMRFREAYNERYSKGLRFVDYNNYKSEDVTIPLENLGKTFEANQLELLSKIELENIKVELIND